DGAAAASADARGAAGGGSPSEPAAARGSSRTSRPAPSHVSSRRRAWAFRLAALATSLLVALLASEALLRHAYGAPLPNRRPLMLRLANPVRGWQMMPRQDHYTYDRRATLDELGFREAPLGAKEPGELRVLALGDSLVYGQGVGDDETLPSVL